MTVTIRTEQLSNASGRSSSVTSDKHVGWSRAFRERTRVLEVTRQVWALPGAPAKMNATELPVHGEANGE